MIVGRLGVGYLMDRIHAPYVAMASLLGPVIGLSLYALGAASGLAVLCAVLIGFGIGAEFDVLGFIIARYFGRKAYGKLYGVLFSVFLSAAGIGAAGLGIVRTKAGTYNPGLWAVAAATLMALLLLGRLGPYTRFGRRSA